MSEIIAEYDENTILSYGDFEDWPLKYVPLNELVGLAKHGDIKLQRFIKRLSWDEKFRHNKNGRTCPYPKPETWEDGPLCLWPRWVGQHSQWPRFFKSGIGPHCQWNRPKPFTKEGLVVKFNEPICESRKIAFIDLESAKKELKRIRKLPTLYNNHKKPVRAYECHICTYFHLTSKP